VLLSWPAASYGDHYLVEIPAAGYRATVAGGRTEHRAPASRLAGLRGEQVARVWRCFATSPGLCGLHHEVSFLPPVPAPQGLAATPSGGTSVDLAWKLTRGVDRYRVEYATSTAGVWDIFTESATSTPITVDGLRCGASHDFRVSSHGDGRAYGASWSRPSATASTTTGACNGAPTFGSQSYSFTVPEDATTTTVVGTVSATDPDPGDTLTYSIAAGNDDGRFALSPEATSTRIVVAGPLDHETGPSYSLTVEAADGRGGTATTTVAITVADVAESPPPAPAGLTATSTASSVTLAWRAPSDATITGYRILRKKLGQSDLSVHVEDTASARTTYVDTVDVEADTTYVYRVKAINAAGAGAQSDYVRIATGRAQ
jgi:hypothetical protein